MMTIDISKTGVTPEEVSDYLLKEKNIFVREGNYTSKLFGDQYIRVSFSIPTEEIMKFREEFPKAVKLLKEKR